MDLNRVKVIYSLIYSDPEKPVRIQEIHPASKIFYDIGFPNQTLKFFQLIRKSIKTHACLLAKAMLHSLSR